MLAEQESPRKARTAEIDDWLRDQLAVGPLTSREVIRRAGLLGWTEKQVQGARRRLHIDPERSGRREDTMSVWSLGGYTVPADQVLPVSASSAVFPNRAEQESKGGTRLTPASSDLYSSSDLTTEREELASEGITRATNETHDLLDTSDAPTLTVTASNGTPLMLTRRDLTP